MTRTPPAPRREKVELYDTTLRDGSQGEGVSFVLEDKLRLAHALDDLGIHYIEGGWPGSNPKDEAFFAAAKKEKFRHAKLAAFGSTRHAKNAPARDPNLKRLVEARTPVVAIFGKAWDLHVRDALRVTPEENLDMVASSVAYLKKRVPTVFFDAEHFFDGYAANPAYALRVLAAAAEAGADALVLCDTNGGRLPREVGEATALVAETFPGRRIGIHTHNDAGLAVATSLEAVRAGARQVQGCVNGFGERAGNADLCVVAPDLELKMGFACLGSKRLQRLARTSRLAYELANLPLRDNQPFVGLSAFAHKGGIHVSAVLRNPETYEHVKPEAVGNIRRVLISELSGRANLIASSPVDLDKHPEKMKHVLDVVMALEREGYTFENASGSLELLIRRAVGEYESPFHLRSFRVITEATESGGKVSEASVKIAVGEHVLHTVAEGRDGPVHALDLAMRKALVHVYGFVEELRLTDYRVAIVNAQAATGARVRVMIDSRDGKYKWGTIGVSENIMEASCRALADSFRYQILKRGVTKIPKRIVHAL